MAGRPSGRTRKIVKRKKSSGIRCGPLNQLKIFAEYRMEENSPWKDCMLAGEVSGSHFPFGIAPQSIN
jgi:hypothetical protein